MQPTEGTSGAPRKLSRVAGLDLAERRRWLAALRSDRYRARQEARGLCTTGCGRPAADGHVECESHLARRRMRSALQHKGDGDG